MLKKQLGLALVLATVFCFVYSKDCETYIGEPCRRQFEQTMINTNDCERKCVTVFPSFDCAKYCSSYPGPTCTAKQITKRSSCSCSSTCIDILAEGDQCDDKGTSYCGERGDNLNCVDGVCAALEV